MNQMRKTVFITGASSGIGLESARYFASKGWNVVATMRNPEKRQTPLHKDGQCELLHLDVLDENSIQSAVTHTIDKYQTIDVLVNNAGYAVYGPFEATTPEQIKREFDTNVFGLMSVTRAFLPAFRKQRMGTIINIASMGGRNGFPLYSIYNSTKFAVEGFSEALAFELKPLNIKVRIIEPGVIKTDFYDRSMDHAPESNLNGDYGDILRQGKKSTNPSFIERGSEPAAVAKVIYQAAIEKGWRLRYPVGTDAMMVNMARWLLPDNLFYRIIEKSTLEQD